HQIGVGLFEESLFRGLLMTAMLVKWGDTAQGRLAVALLSGVLFGTCHIINMFFNGSSLQFTLFNLVVAAALGFGFAAMYVYSRNLLGCMIVHAVYDFIANLSSQLPNRLVLLVILGLISLFAIVLCIVAKPFCVGVIPLRKKELKAQE
ncbi:MAG: CPBP family intramembrane metalloprotease, partial [Oscillospiraceae bacterium]|nr:CPBP family intramembrane metalloprotease [Oscillospiraceae bacterium]